TVAICSPVAGSNTGTTASDSGSTHSPPIRRRGGRSRNSVMTGDGAGCAGIAFALMLLPSSVAEPSSKTISPPRTAPPQLPAAQSEELDRVLLEDQRLDLVAEAGFLEILEPAVRRDQRVVRAEQHLAL